MRFDQGYVFGSYAKVVARYFLRTKDPVAHPLWPSDGDWAYREGMDAAQPEF